MHKRQAHLHGRWAAGGRACRRGAARQWASPRGSRRRPRLAPSYCTPRGQQFEQMNAIIMLCLYACVCARTPSNSPCATARLAKANVHMCVNNHYWALLRVWNSLGGSVASGVDAATHVIANAESLVEKPSDILVITAWEGVEVDARKGERRGQTLWGVTLRMLRAHLRMLRCAAASSASSVSSTTDELVCARALLAASAACGSVPEYTRRSSTASYCGNN